jgi:hypothetical protein
MALPYQKEEEEGGGGKEKENGGKEGEEEEVLIVLGFWSLPRKDEIYTKKKLAVAHL